MSISQMAHQIRAREKQGLPGSLVHATASALLRLSLVNLASQAKQVDTITVDTAADDTVYTFTVNGVTVSYTSGTGATETTIRDGLLDAVNAEPAVRGVVVPSENSTDALDLTSVWPGVAFTTLESDSNLSLALTTSNAEAAAVGFGLAVVKTPQGADDNQLPGGVALDSLFTAQVVTVDYTYNASDTLTVVIFDKHNGNREIARAVHTLATSKDASSTALAAALNAQLPANTVIAANAGASGYEITLTAEVAGLEFDVAVYSSDPGTVAESAAYTTGPNLSTSLLRAFTGIAERRTDVEGESYPANNGFVALLSEQVWVYTEESIAHGDPVYVELDDSGGLQGRFYKTASATRLKLPGLSWVRGAHSDNASDNIGVIDLSVDRVRSYAS